MYSSNLPVLYPIFPYDKNVYAIKQHKKIQGRSTLNRCKAIIYLYPSACSNASFSSFPSTTSVCPASTSFI